MGWLGDLWNGFMDVLGIGTSATQTAINYDINQKNYDLAKQNYEFQKDSYNKSFGLQQDAFNFQKDSYNKTFGLQQDAFNFQKDSYLKNFEYQKNLQQQLFNREDNSIQRRVADMEKAGLSKTLAAGAGAGAGPVVSTVGSNASFGGSGSHASFGGSGFSGSAPQRSQVDLISAALQLSSAQAQIKKTNAEAENLIKDSKKKDSDILFTDAQTAYTKAKTAVEEKNYDILNLTEEEIKLSNEKARKEMAKIDVELKSLELGYDIKKWEYENVYPVDLQKKIQEVANLRKAGRYRDAQIIYQDIRSDILTQELMQAEIESKIKALDYEYQSITGMKPDSNSNWIVQFISSLLGSDTADTLIEAIVPGYKSGSKPEHSNDTKGKYHDKTPR